MKEEDRLRSVLREWEAPEPSPGLDARVRAAYRAARRTPWWERIWAFRVSIPVPVLAAALLLLAAGFWLQWRSAPPARPAAASPGYLTRLESAGFQPLPDGEVRVIRKKGVRQ